MPVSNYHPFTDNTAQSIASLGEVRLIESILGWLGQSSPASPYGIGDDCAVLPSSRHRQLLTVDPVVYNEHFNDRTSPADAGRKLLNRNLSDIASMGGRPRAAVISLALESRVKTSWLENFYRSIAATARRQRLPIVGGDITRLGQGIVATLTLVGEASTPRILTRSGARAGDHIYVTGTLGGSILGKHCRFTPRLKEGAWLVKNPQVHSMMDVSDGLAKDLPSLTPPTLKAMLFPKKIPVSSAAKRLAKNTGQALLQHALGDGEDYELLFSLSKNADTALFEKSWRRHFKTPLARIGFFAKKDFSKNIESAVNLASLSFHGYEHFGKT